MCCFGVENSPVRSIGYDNEKSVLEAAGYGTVIACNLFKMNNLPAQEHKK
jgi:hypothetical protein